MEKIATDTFPFERLRTEGCVYVFRFAGFDDVALAAQHKLTTCRQPLDDLAHVAFQTLLQRIKSPRLPPRTILLPAPQPVAGCILAVHPAGIMV